MGTHALGDQRYQDPSELELQALDSTDAGNLMLGPLQEL